MNKEAHFVLKANPNFREHIFLALALVMSFSIGIWISFSPEQISNFSKFVILFMMNLSFIFAILFHYFQTEYKLIEIKDSSFIFKCVTLLGRKIKRVDLINVNEIKFNMYRVNQFSVGKKETLELHYFVDFLLKNNQRFRFQLGWFRRKSMHELKSFMLNNFPEISIKGWVSEMPKIPD